MEKIQVICEIEITIKMIGGKYKPLILHYLLENGCTRFNTLLSYITHISQKTLTNQLRELERDGLIHREVYAEVPPKVVYSMTDKGKTLAPILESMCEWGYRNKDDRFEITNPQCTD